MTQPNEMIYRVWHCNEAVMYGTLAECYEAYPILACADAGKSTKRGWRCTPVS